MSIDELLDLVRNGKEEIQDDWVRATALRPIILGDPALVWLDYFGKANGFEPDESPYDFLYFIGGKGREFEEKWVREVAPTAVTVCQQDYEVRSLGKVLETLVHLQAGVPVIAKPALWWGQERIYGVPDLIVHTSWLEREFPQCVTAYEQGAVAANLSTSGKPGHYVAFDIKFTTGLDGSNKKVPYAISSAQARIYSYILGHVQGLMPRNAHLITRERLFEPLAIKITSTLGQPLDFDLAAMRDQFIKIKLQGSNFRPWRDDIVAADHSNRDEKWRTAKEVIARERFPGRDPCLLHEVSPSVKRELRGLGFPSLDSLLGVDPAKIPLEKCKGLGLKKSRVMRAILQANRSGQEIPPSNAFVPAQKQYEFFVDFEYLSNLNVDFEKQWPTLEGREMVFMAGVGRVTDDRWSFKSFVCAEESREKERDMFLQFIHHLNQITQGCAIDPSKTVLYHWTGAEMTQSCRASDRQCFDAQHPLRKLPWCDLRKFFLEAPAAIPGGWGYSLKETAKALGKLRPDIGVNWPEELEEGLKAMVMGWRAYSSAEPLKSNEMALLNTYLEIDCLALFSVLRWLRA